MKFVATIVIILTLFSCLICRRYKTSTARYLTRFSQSFTNIGKSTQVNDWGSGNTIYLDRHHINCGIGALTGFHYKRVGTPKFKYDYQCIEPKSCNKKCENKIKEKDKTRCKTHQTPLNDIVPEYGKATNYLDRHRLKCPVSYVLQSFRFARGKPPKVNLVSKALQLFRLAKKPPGKAYYHYTCCPAKLTNCKSFNTKDTSFGDFSTIYLDRQNVSVPDPKTQAITGFKLNTIYPKRGYTYTVDYCTVTG